MSGSVRGGEQSPDTVYSFLLNKKGKWYLLELNQGHTDFQSDALPAELRHHCCLRVQN